MPDQRFTRGVTGKESAEKEGWERLGGNDLWLSDLLLKIRSGILKVKVESLFPQHHLKWQQMHSQPPVHDQFVWTMFAGQCLLSAPGCCALPLHRCDEGQSSNTMAVSSRQPDSPPNRDAHTSDWLIPHHGLRPKTSSESLLLLEKRWGPLVPSASARPTAGCDSLAARFNEIHPKIFCKPSVIISEI